MYKAPVVRPRVLSQHDKAYAEALALAKEIQTTAVQCAMCDKRAVTNIVNGFFVCEQQTCWQKASKK